MSAEFHLHPRYTSYYLSGHTWYNQRLAEVNCLFETFLASWADGVSLPLLANQGADCSRKLFPVNHMRLHPLVGQAFFRWPTRHGGIRLPPSRPARCPGAACKKNKEHNERRIVCL